MCALDLFCFGVDCWTMVNQLITYRSQHLAEDMSTPLKTNMDTQNDGLEKVAPFEFGHFWYLC